MKKIFFAGIIVISILTSCRSKQTFNSEDFTLGTATSQIKEVPDITYESSGNNSLKEFIFANLEYTRNLIGDNLKGEALLDVVVGADGRVVNVKILESSGYNKYDEELLRIVKVLPRWIMGRPVDKYLQHRYTLKVTYKVDGVEDAAIATLEGKINFKK